jgi:hypothetical protein
VLYLPLSIRDELNLALSLRQCSIKHEPSTRFRAGALLLDFLWKYDTDTYLKVSHYACEGFHLLEHYVPGSIYLGHSNQVVDNVEDAGPPFIVGMLDPAAFVWWFSFKIFWASGYIDYWHNCLYNPERSTYFVYVYMSFEPFFFSLKKPSKDSTRGAFLELTILHDGWLEI